MINDYDTLLSIDIDLQPDFCISNPVVLVTYTIKPFRCIYYTFL